MPELANIILEHFQEHGQYVFSSDHVQKAEENNAIDYLANNGYITIKMRTIGYFFASVV